MFDRFSLHLSCLPLNNHTLTSQHEQLRVATRIHAKCVKLDLGIGPVREYHLLLWNYHEY